MWRNYLKIALRSLWRQRGYAAINIGGLAIALTTFVLVVLYADHEKSFDRWDPQLGKIYLVNEFNGFMSNSGEEQLNDICDTKTGGFLARELPGLKAVTIVDGYEEQVNVDIDGSLFQENGLKDADSSFFKVFPFRFVEGVPKGVLHAPHSMVLTESLARKWFGSADPLGKMVKLREWIMDPGTDYRITGIIRDPDKPSSLYFTGIYDSGEADAPPTESTSDHFANIYLLTDGKLKENDMERVANRIYTTHLAESLRKGESFMNGWQKTSFAGFTKAGHRYGLRMQAFQDLHLHPLKSKSSLQKIMPLALLSLMLLLVGIINYTNLATVQAMHRAREIGVRKVMGARRSQLILQILGECLWQCAAALFLSLVLVELLLPWFNRAFDLSLSLWSSDRIGNIGLQMIGVMVLTTLLAGGYPSLMISGYDSARVLKGDFTRGKEGNIVRNLLVVLQFGIAVVFIIGLGIVHRQVSFLQHRDLGFNPVGVINLRDSRDRALVSRLKNIPGVYAVGSDTQVMGDGMDMSIKVRYGGKQRNISLATVDMESLQALNVKLLQGRLFSSAFGQDSFYSAIINETAARELGGNVIGQTIYENDTTGKTIIGVIADYQYAGFNQGISATMYTTRKRGPSGDMPNLLIRYDTRAAGRIIPQIEKDWKSVHPGYLIQYSYLTDEYNKLMQDDRRFQSIIQTFTLISLLLSLMGIFALSAFVSGLRAKEIGIRRVFGASVRDILRLLNQDFVRLVFLANIIAWPVAYLLTRQWLDGFAYRISIPAAAFLIAGLVSIAVTILTVTAQAYRTAVAGPAKTLRHE